MLCTLEDFPSFSSEKETPLCEIDGKLHFSHHESANLHGFTSCVSSHPHILITNTCLHPIVAKTLGSKVFLPVRDSLSHRLQNAWHEGGLTQVLQILADQDEHNFIVGCFVAAQALRLLQFMNKLKLPLSREIENKTVDTSRKQGPVLCMAWHPHCSKLAIVSSDDCVNIFSIGCSLNPVLKAKSQKFITCISWRPLSSCEIAVGCYEGVYVWTVDPNSVISRPSISCATLLQAPGHRGISSIAWSPEGDILVSASSKDNTMYVWDVEMRTSTPLKRVGGNGIGLLKWNLDGSKLLAASTTTTFRVWNVNEMWEGETWSSVGGPVAAAAWSPGASSVLLFSCRTTPFLYAMPTGARSTYFTSRTTDSRTVAQIVADLTKLTLESGEWVGGEVVDMSWDRRGKHLAVMFEECPLIAIFLTNVTPLFHVVPGFFIKGMKGEIPSAISFQNDFDEGANLTIAWNSGRVQYFPFIFGPDNLPSVNITTSLLDKSAHYYSFTSPS